MRVFGVTGWSGSGKTTLLVELIAHLVARGLRVAAIKHTHHAVNDEDRGDTARFRVAGAAPVVLAGNGVAIVFSDSAPRRETWREPTDILSLVDADIVLVEGFKGRGDWPRLELSAEQRHTPDDVAAILDRIAAP